MTKDKSQRIGNQLKFLPVLFFVTMSLFASLVNGTESILSGTWECKQSEIISDSMRGENIYTLDYSKNSNIVHQSGNISIIDVTKSLESSIKYNLKFEFSYDGSVFENTLKHLEHDVVSDQLNVLTFGVY